MKLSKGAIKQAVKLLRKAKQQTPAHARTVAKRIEKVVKEELQCLNETSDPS